MARFVAFLRAVNVGKRTVAMARARAILESLGYAQVSSFVNSGNLIFTTDTTRTAELEAAIRAALEDAFGFEVTTFVRTERQVTALIEAEPFAPLAVGHTHFALLPLTPLTPAERRAVTAMSNDRDEVIVAGRDVHWLIRAKSTETSLGPKQWRDAMPGNPSTARNLTMLRRLVDKL